MTKKMLQEMHRDSDKIFIGWDQKIFTMEAQIDAQNDVIQTVSSDSIYSPALTFFHRQKLAGVMVWAAVASVGSKSSFLFLREGVKVNSHLYSIML